MNVAFYLKDEVLDKSRNCPDGPVRRLMIKVTYSL
jgi:hypothetical protein